MQVLVLFYLCKYLCVCCQQLQVILYCKVALVFACFHKSFEKYPHYTFQYKLKILLCLSSVVKRNLSDKKECIHAKNKIHCIIYRAGEKYERNLALVRCLIHFLSAKKHVPQTLKFYHTLFIVLNFSLST